ncbi:amidophosphoribosyltransferase [Palleniella muris]|uniref:Amidophosphoribosyltransferase n=1 Tax=Palleniella muris TaxID=3038145 RepID=A0AC61QLZ7_9BACT|nr:amidophosphoribosyltransferase [Palleniella muris]TGX80145.1 amidophosphoribosyltransferase [Palleniella muris]
MEQLKHECGIAMIRLLKPLEYYEKKYGTRAYGLGKLYLMMEKQHNRGQEGAGIASVHLDAVPGKEYMFREKAQGKDAITEIFSRVDESFAGELLMGHLRYSTTGNSGLTFVHPFLRRNNWRAKNLCLCGNFNMTNIDEIFRKLTAQGQFPRIYSDSYIMLELMGHRLDREVERNFSAAKAEGLEGTGITDYIDAHMEIGNVLETTMKDFDGGYVVCGLTGSGELFVMRDPWGIRPAFYYRDEELVAVASECPVLQTTFNLDAESVKELAPGCSLAVRRNGEVGILEIMPPKTLAPCSFERIYFSRGNDRDIYRERRCLGEQLVPAITEALGGDVDNTVFSFIPNTAEVAYYGMLHGFMRQGHDVRFEKIAWKDIKLRTFITGDALRNDLAAHVYDVTYGVVRPYEDNLVVIDDSIVRGTTLRESIIKILDRLHPKKIVIVSSSPQIRYPDFYGIDMARMEEFIAFRACVSLLERRGMKQLIEDVYKQCMKELEKSAWEQSLPVKELYAAFNVDELNEEMVRLLRTEDVSTPIELVFQSIEGLHAACPGHGGDWYFTGNYPTPGGVRLCNRAFANWFEEHCTASGE